MSPRMMLAAPAVLASEEQAVRDADARYWQALNACDLTAMDGLFIDDM